MTVSTVPDAASGVSVTPPAPHGAATRSFILGWSMQSLLTRRWIAIHLLTVVIVAVCLSLASWQLRRLEQRRSDNARLAAQIRLPPAPLPELLPTPDSPKRLVEEARYRRVEVQGRFDAGEQVVLQSRTFKRRQGDHLLTPLVLASGDAILVDRGWVPLPGDARILNEASPPSGTLTVTGTLLPSEEKGFLGVSDPPPGKVSAIPRVDLDRLAAQMPYQLYPVYVRLEGQVPGNRSALPEPVPLPAPDEGPHQEYALQWFLFAATALVVYIGMTRREVARSRVPAEQAEEPDPVAI